MTTPDPAAQPEVNNAIHNSNENAAAADAGLCGRTHLASGRLCLLPERHPGGCDFRQENDVPRAIDIR